ncbi:GntR family transcriptional regulator [Nocardia sp. NPDC020380]|uniref:GntR family transcriptional regulator n=1 Tax=Nocardia sp. NPDC020380 TaxID=3364309 RepID=UPI0037A19B21
MADPDRRLFVERPERLTERELGELTGVSRTSLREALRSLQAEGLVETSEARGIQIAVLTETVVGELDDVRALLEATAVELCARNASDAQIDELRAAVPGNSILEQVFGSIEARIHQRPMPT